MTTALDRDAFRALMPLALGHDQEATACPWVQLTRRTADYPSRKAQAALAVVSGVVPITPDVVDLLYRCDGCGRCLAASTLPRPPDLARLLWQVRASLVARGAVPEANALAELRRVHHSLYGNLGPAFARLGPGDEGADVLFLPGPALLDQAPGSASAALRAARLVEGRIALDWQFLDSGQELVELGLADDAGALRDAFCHRLDRGGYRSVLTGTPKDAFGLREALGERTVEVRYVGAALAAAATSGRLSLPTPEVDGAVAFHPSESLLHRLGEFETIDRWLGTWLGMQYRRETNPGRESWPAAIERPSVRVPAELSRAMAERRLAQLLTPPDGEDVAVILTCDPWSWRALREVAPVGVDVVDLIEFATRCEKGVPADG